MKAAFWNGAKIGESNETVVVEGNHYFPPDSVHMELLQSSPTTSGCPWKGTAKYYTVVVGGKINKDAAWYYPEPSEAAEKIKGYIAFWKGVEVK